MSDYSAADLAKLKSAYAQGVAEISRGDERIKFRSLNEMERVINRVERSLAGTTTGGVHYPEFSKGV